MFITEDFLLDTGWSRKLYHEVAVDLPIIDYHAHLPPTDLAARKKFRNIAELWLGSGNYGDHYKWRLMRAAGVPERLITGDAPDRERFDAFCRILPLCAGSRCALQLAHRAEARLQGINTVIIPQPPRGSGSRRTSASPAWTPGGLPHPGQGGSRLHHRRSGRRPGAARGARQIGPQDQGAARLPAGQGHAHRGPRFPGLPRAARRSGEHEHHLLRRPGARAGGPRSSISMPAAAAPATTPSTSPCPTAFPRPAPSRRCSAAASRKSGRRPQGPRRLRRGAAAATWGVPMPARAG